MEFEDKFRKPYNNYCIWQSFFSIKSTQNIDFPCIHFWSFSGLFHHIDLVLSHSLVRFVGNVDVIFTFCNKFNTQAIESVALMETPLFLRFINMIVNDATIQLDEGLEVFDGYGMFVSIVCECGVIMALVPCRQNGLLTRHTIILPFF